MAALIVGPRAQAQTTDLPWACAGTTERYWVKGFNGQSDFEWRVYHNNGDTRTELTSEILDYYSPNGDTVLITWPEDRGGFYTFEVVETSIYGCIGSMYSEDIIVNSQVMEFSFDNVPESFFVCMGETAVLDPGAQFVNHLWIDTDAEDPTSSYYTTTEAGTYMVRITLNDDDNQSCAFHEIEAGFWELPTVDLGPDTALNLAEDLVLDAYNPDFDFYKWYQYNFSLGEFAEDTYVGSSPTYTVDAGMGTQWISVVVIDKNGCMGSDSVRIEGVDFGNLRIPSAFIPASPVAENRVWLFPVTRDEEGVRMPLYHLFDDIEVRVFNRWGSPVFHSSGTYVPWDGTDGKGNPLPMDSYHYIIRFKISGKVYNYKGSVTIIR
jgi:hypothetical protein